VLICKFIFGRGYCYEKQFVIVVDIYAAMNLLWPWTTFLHLCSYTTL